MTFREYNISPMYVRNGLDYDSLDVGTLCLSPNINPWSERKPMNFGASSLAEREAYYPNISGFKINNSVLEYDKPTALNGYWLSDFSLYNHTARKPSNVVIEQNFFEDPTTNKGQDKNPLVLTLLLPNTEVVKKWASETIIQADTVSITDINGVVLPSSVNGQYARSSLAGISETNYSIQIQLSLDLSAYNELNNYSFTYYIWYGNSSNYKKFKIPSGDTVTITGKVLSYGVNISATIVPLDKFPPYTISNYSNLSTGTFNSTNSTYTFNTFRIEGIAKSVDSSYIYQFQNKTGWNLYYRVLNSDGTIKVADTLIPVAYTADATATVGRYYITSSLQWTINNVVNGNEIRFVIKPESGYFV